MLNAQNINTIVQTIIKTVNGKYSVALAGSLARGIADDKSDLDIYIYVEEMKSADECLAIIKTIADDNKRIYINTQINETPWGGSIDFYYQQIPVEITIKKRSLTEKKIDDSINGDFDIIPATWTSNGYYTFIVLGETYFIKALDDCDDWLEINKNKVKHYPLKLKTAIQRRFMARASTWMNNFHYKSAIERTDILFTTPIVIHTVLDMVQVIFAINEQYFTGDKKLIEELDKLPYCPAHLLKNISFLLTTAANVPILERQYQLLNSIFEELKTKINK